MLCSGILKIGIQILHLSVALMLRQYFPLARCHIFLSHAVTNEKVGGISLT